MPNEQWEPVEGIISPEERQAIAEYCGKTCFPRTRNWRKLNMIRSFYPQAIPPKQLLREFRHKAWAINFDTINRQLYKGFFDGSIKFRCQVIYKKEKGGYTLSNMVPID